MHPRVLTFHPHTHIRCALQSRRHPCRWCYCAFGMFIGMFFYSTSSPWLRLPLLLAWSSRAAHTLLPSDLSASKIIWCFDQHRYGDSPRPSCQSLVLWPHIRRAERRGTPLQKTEHTTFSLSRVYELDWWDERLFRVSLPSNAGAPAVNAEVRLSCTPSQHVSGRTGLNRWHVLWASTRTREYILLATLDTVRSATEKTKTKFRYAPHLSNLEYVDSVDVAFNHRVRDDSFFYHIDTNFNLILIDWRFVVPSIICVLCGRICIPSLQMLCGYSRMWGPNKPLPSIGVSHTQLTPHLDSG